MFCSGQVDLCSDKQLSWADPLRGDDGEQNTGISDKGLRNQGPNNGTKSGRKARLQN